jgi:poly(beta-D-mannuronate) C5 epimerase
VIAGNTAIGTQRRHGIVVSRGVSDSWILENRAVGNAGTGIVLDAASTDNVVAFNLVGANRGDGLSLFESSRNLLWGNLAVANAKSGLRVRNAGAVEVHRNVFVGNGYDGIEAYAKHRGRVRRTPLEPQLAMTLQDNRFAGNRRTALNLRSPARIDLLRGPGASGPLRLGGDLAGCGAAVHRHLAAWGGLRIVGRAQAPASSPCTGS